MYTGCRIRQGGGLTLLTLPVIAILAYCMLEYKVYDEQLGLQKQVEDVSRRLADKDICKKPQIINSVRDANVHVVNGRDFEKKESWLFVWRALPSSWKDTKLLVLPNCLQRYTKGGIPA